MPRFTVETDNPELVEALTDLFRLAGEITGTAAEVENLASTPAAAAAEVWAIARETLQETGANLDALADDVPMKRAARQALFAAGDKIEGAVDRLAVVLDLEAPGWDEPPAGRRLGIEGTD